MNKIDELYRDALHDHVQQASAYTGARMRWRLFWLNYNRYILGIGTAAIIGFAIYFGTGVYRGDQEKSPVNERVATSASQDELIENVPVIEKGELDKEIYTSTGRGRDKVTKEALLPVANGAVEQNVQSNVIIMKREALTEAYQNDIFLTEEINSVETVQLCSIEKVEFNKITLTSQNRDIATLLSNSETIKTPYEIDSEKNWFSIGFYFTPAYNSFTLKTTKGYEEHLQYRKEHESPAISVSAGINVRLNVRNWYIQTGLEYSEFRQYRNYNHSFLTLDSLSSYYQTDTIWGWIFDPPNIGEPIILAYDTTFFPVYDDMNEGYNKWNYLEVPLIAGYKFKTGRFNFEVGTGFSCAFLLNTDGNVPHLTDKNSFVDLKDLKDDMNKYLFSYILQVGASYYITPNWSVNISPFYKQNLNSVFNSNYPIDQKFRSIGINVGLKVDL